MQEKRGRGRQPTGGRKRDKSFRIFLTNYEKELIKARPCVFFVSMLRSRHSKRHEHTGENEPTKRKKKGANTVIYF